MNTNATDIYPPGVIGPNGQVLESPWYDYLVTKSTCIIFVALFSITTIIHVVQAIHYRMWWLLPTVGLAGLGEIIGWGGRLWSSISPLLRDPYIMQICATIIAPTPFVGGLFILFSKITMILGTRYSRITPQWYTRLFLTVDIVALVIQAVGGGLAATASTQSGSTMGANIMLGGIVFQLVSILVFICIAAEYLTRYFHDHPIRPEGTTRAEGDRRIKLLVSGMAFILLCLVIRSIYRTAELADGWEGRIITTEVYFNVLDGAMIVLAMFTLNFFHPGLLLKVPSGSQRTHIELGEPVDLRELTRDKGVAASFGS